jgi:hypothetical protein
MSSNIQAFHSGFPLPFLQCQAAVQQPFRAFPSSYWQKPGNFFPFSSNQLFEIS